MNIYTGVQETLLDKNILLKKIKREYVEMSGLFISFIRKFTIKVHFDNQKANDSPEKSIERMQMTTHGSHIGAAKQ